MKRPHITPGEWFKRPMGHEIYVESEKSFICDMQAKNAEDQETAHADAQAIAALPCLLSALESIWQGGCSREDMREYAFDALKEAGYTF